MAILEDRWRSYSNAVLKPAFDRLKIPAEVMGLFEASFFAGGASVISSYARGVGFDQLHSEIVEKIHRHRAAESNCEPRGERPSGRDFSKLPD